MQNNDRFNTSFEKYCTINKLLQNLFRTLLQKTHITNVCSCQSLQGHLSVAQNFFFSLHIPSDFAFLMSIEIISHIFGASEDVLSLPKYAAQFLNWNISKMRKTMYQVLVQQFF